MCGVLTDTDNALIRTYYMGKKGRFAEESKNTK